MPGFPNEELEAITIELLPDEALNPGLYNCWQYIILGLGDRRFQYFKAALEQIEATHDYGDDALTIEVFESTHSPTDIATVSGFGVPDEYYCQIGDLIALMKRAVEIL
jgi:hypothetical protein